MKFARVGVGVGKIQATEEPFFGTRAEARVNVKITFAHILN